ncbi:hypothetical protein KC871_04110 [Candidatus Saccharibacteria bacterium]|nr:hypothetical protein [Candidatus Saccharibacteria bacterium]
MKTINNFTYMGRKQKIGGIIFDEHDRLFIFVTYCPSCHAKVLFTRGEAQEFAKHFRSKQNKLRTKIIIQLVNR